MAYKQFDEFYKIIHIKESLSGTEISRTIDLIDKPLNFIEDNKLVMYILNNNDNFLISKLNKFNKKKLEIYYYCIKYDKFRLFTLFESIFNNIVIK
jgi:hypothetical protein